MRLFTM